MQDTKTKKIQILTIIFIVVIAITTAILCCSNHIRKNLSAQLENNLIDVSSQNALAISNQVLSRKQLLDSLSSELISLPGDMSDNVSLMSEFVSIYDLKRLGYCSLDGYTHSTDGAIVDLSYRDFFRRGINGQYTISDVLSDAMTPSHDNVTVMSGPMYDNNDEIIGVFCMTYDSDDFSDTLCIDSFDGYGQSIAITLDGKITISNGNHGLNLSDNFFSILGEGNNDIKSLNNLRQTIEKNSSTLGNLSIYGEDYYYYCTPVSLMDGDSTWYVFTLVPQSYLLTRLKTLNNNLNILNLFIILFIFIATFSVVALTKAQHNSLLKLAYNDPLTGGDNYLGFCNQLNHIRNHSGYLVSLDIANFNNVNVAVGKALGDTFIKRVWDSIVASLISNEIAGRVREDQFVLFLNNQDKKEIASRLATLSNSVHDLALLYQIPGLYCYCGVYQMSNNDLIDDAYSKARAVHELCKANSKDNNIRFFSESDHEEFVYNQGLVERLETALENEEFEVYFQPKYSARKRILVGSEALVRWITIDNTIIPPNKFISLFEQNGSIAKLDEYVFRKACARQKEWQRQGYKIFPISVNISRSSLLYSDVVLRYQHILMEYDLDPIYVQLEVTESAIIDHENIHDLLRNFRAMGIQILMDDFGTGYSSLATLSMNCFDTIKLDKSLIDNIGNKNGETLLHYVIKMGRRLGLHLTAEGVETAKQLEYLQDQLCDDIQGYYFSKPLPATDFQKLLFKAS